MEESQLWDQDIPIEDIQEFEESDTSEYASNGTYRTSVESVDDLEPTEEELERSIIAIVDKYPNIPI